MAEHFTAAVQSPEGTGATAFIEVPESIVAALESTRRPPVRVTLKGYEYRTTVAVYGGRYYLGVRKEIRDAAGVILDEPIDVSVELDAEPRTVELPDDLANRLAAQPELQAAFAGRSYTQRKEYVDWVTAAKRPTTRERRIERVLAQLQP
jgi:hypothetical protein